MLNQVVVVGRLAEEPAIDKKNKLANITLAIPRSYSNSEGEYDSDFISCKLTNELSQSISCLSKGDLLGIKGRLENLDTDNLSKTLIRAEKLTFLTNKGFHDTKYDEKQKDIK